MITNEFARGGVRGIVRAEKILFATNALSLDLAGYEESQATPRLTLAALTPPLPEKKLAAIGLGERKPFYTVDFPYLWGRVRRDRSIVWGAGLVAAPGSRDLETLDIRTQEPRKPSPRSKTASAICIPRSRTRASRTPGAGQSCSAKIGRPSSPIIPPAKTPSSSAPTPATA